MAGPVDPRLWKELPRLRPTLAGLAGYGLANGALAIGTAFALAWLTTAVVRHGAVGLAGGAAE